MGNLDAEETIATISMLLTLMMINKRKPTKYFHVLDASLGMMIRDVLSNTLQMTQHSFCVSTVMIGLDYTYSWLDKKMGRWADMKKGVDTRTLSAEILTECGNCLLKTLNFSCICFLKLKYYGTFTYIIQYDHLNANLNLIKVTNHA